MSFETFTWRVTDRTAGKYVPSLLTAQFNDGYEAVAVNGPRTQALRTTWPFVVPGSKAEVLEVHRFLERNMGRRFIWRDPFTGERRLWRCVAWESNPQGGPTWTVSGEFKYAGQLPPGA